MPKNKPKRNLNLNNLVKKKTLQLLNLKLSNLQERAPKHQWTNKPKKYKNNLSKLLRLKMEQKRLNQLNLQNNPVKNKLLKNQLSNLNHHYKRLNLQFKRQLFLKRKFNNQVNNLNNNNLNQPKKPQQNL